MLFTIILEFAGTNSVSQFSASGPNAAFQKWVQGLESPNNYALTSQQGRAVTKSLTAKRELRDGHQLTQLRGLTNVWCVIAFAGRKPRRCVLLNIIATVGRRRK